MNADTAPVERPLRADARRNRERVLAAADEAFALEGPAVPLDEIARRAGVGAGTVHRHFPTKESLLEAVLVGRLETMLAEVRAALTAPDSGYLFFDFFRTMTTYARNKMDLADALGRHGIDVISATRTVSTSLKAALAELLRRAQEVGEVRSDITVDDLHALVVAAVAAVQAVAPEEAPRVGALVSDALRPRGGR
ncbi:TetR/AcrR family transcriptional regulator [Catenulispora yoronensis]|uniref:TetR/AcrR family transcriptional regulator n=1 Tax=Catenulispora yoronensis TaxID=450799 RepID=A0ABP5F8C2_9ACTN